MDAIQNVVQNAGCAVVGCKNKPGSHVSFSRQDNPDEIGFMVQFCEACWSNYVWPAMWALDRHMEERRRRIPGESLLHPSPSYTSSHRRSSISKFLLTLARPCATLSFAARSTKPNRGDEMKAPRTKSKVVKMPAIEGSEFLDPTEIVNFLQAIPTHQIFTVVFRKKGNAELRKMTCKRGVTKKLKGGESTIKDHANLQGVYDMNALDEEGKPGAYRCFDTTRVLLVKGIGSELRVKGFKPGAEDIIDAKGEKTKI